MRRPIHPNQPHSRFRSCRPLLSGLNTSDGALWVPYHEGSRWSVLGAQSALFFWMTLKRWPWKDDLAWWPCLMTLTGRIQAFDRCVYILHGPVILLYQFIFHTPTHAHPHPPTIVHIILTYWKYSHIHVYPKEMGFWICLCPRHKFLVT